METFGQRLRRARKAKGWTQERVARELRVDRTTYCKYETGKVEPPITLCFHLCVVLGLTPNALMGWEEAPPVMEKEAQAALQEKWPQTLYLWMKELFRKKEHHPKCLTIQKIQERLNS